MGLIQAYGQDLRVVQEVRRRMRTCIHVSVCVYVCAPLPSPAI